MASEKHQTLPTFFESKNRIVIRNVIVNILDKNIRININYTKNQR